MACCCSVRGHRLPVDRGWAWVVVLGAAVLCGIQGSIQSINDDVIIFMLYHFVDTQSLAPWVVGLSGTVAMIFGPLLSALILKTSHRFVAVVGIIAVAAGTATICYIPTLEASVFTYSLLNGFGTTVLYLVSFTCTAPYFDRHLGLAIGLTNAGCVGLSVVLPPLLPFFHDMYGFNNAMLLYSGIILQGAVFAFLIRPTSYYESGNTAAEAPQEQMEASQVRRVSDHPIDDNRTSFTLRDTQEDEEERGEWQQQHYGIVTPEKAVKAIAKTGIAVADNCQEHHGVHALASVNNDVGDIPMHLARRETVGVTTLLLNKKMWIVGIVMHFTVSAQCIALTAIRLKGEASGVTRTMTFILMAVSAVLGIGSHVLQGWLADRRFVPTLVQFGLSAGAAGFCAALGSIVGGAAGLGVAAVAFGMFALPLRTLLVLVLRDLLGIDRVTSALGFLMPLQIPAYLISGFVMGYLEELDSSLRYVFYYISANFMLSFACCMAYSLRMKMYREASNRHKSARRRQP